MAGTSPAMTPRLLLRRRGDGDQDRAHVVAAIDDLPVLVRADETGIVFLQDRFLAVDDQRQFAGQDEVDFLRRRSVGPGAAARQKMRNADDQALGATSLGAEK